MNLPATTKNASPFAGTVTTMTTAVTTRTRSAARNPRALLMSSAATTPSACPSGGYATATAIAWTTRTRETCAIPSMQRHAPTVSLPAPMGTAFMSHGIATVIVTALMVQMKMTVVSTLNALTFPNPNINNKFVHCLFKGYQ